MDLNRLSYHHRLFLLLLAFSWILVACFVAYQYGREKEYKIERLDEHLQLYNARLADALRAGTPPDSFMQEVSPPFSHLRVSIIDLQGRVIFDNSLPGTIAENHLNRPEVARAMTHGTGRTVRRHSESTHGSYFYSATRSGDIVVRSAAPYTVTLSQVLAADKGFLWFMGGVTLLLSVAAWFATRRIGRTVSRLNRFAEKAERGERIYDDEPFPADEFGEISHHIVTLYAQSQRRHEEALRQEQEKIRIKKQLTNNINHELKTPLAAIQVCLETLISHPELPAEKRMTFIRRCHENSERLRSLLADVSTLTRIDDGRDMIAREPVSLRSVIDAVTADFSSDAMLPIHISMDSDPILMANRPLLEAVFSNLIRNANDYSQGSRIDIRVSSSSGSAAVITLCDDGCGIPDEHLPHIFERFYRIDKGRSRAKGGTGLGLAIVRNAISFHHGTIAASNLPDGGLKFTITLPCVRV